MCDKCEIDQKKSLGFIEPPKAFSTDIEILKQYQLFSSELLRISLLAITAIAVLLLAIIKGDSVNINDFSRYMILISAGMFGISSAAALTHRYCSADSLTQHLAALRYEARGRVDDAKAAKACRQARKRMFVYTEWALWVGSVALALGALAVAFGVGIAVVSGSPGA